MAWKRSNPGDPCCDGCPPVLCIDGVTTKRIVTRSLELSFPDKMIFMLPQGTTRTIFISTGWSGMSGTYTWHINENCQFPGSFGGVEIVQERRAYANSDGLATCGNYDSLTPLSINYDYLSGGVFLITYASLSTPGYVFMPTFTPYYRIFFDFPPGESAGRMCEETELAVRVEIASPLGEFCSFPGATAIANAYE